jgi:hypothetical protein
MNTDLTVRLHGGLPDSALPRLRELLGLEAPENAAQGPETELGHRYLDALHTVALSLLRHADGTAELRVTSLLMPPQAQTLEQCRADILSAARELGLSVEPEAGADVGGHGGFADVDDGRPVAARRRVPAPPPGAGPVSLEQAEAIAAEWINAGRPDDGQVGAGVYEFELGYIVYPVGAPRTEIGTARGVINKRTGELSVWPSLALETVAELYRAKVRSATAGALHDA